MDKRGDNNPQMDKITCEEDIYRSFFKFIPDFQNENPSNQGQRPKDPDEKNKRNMNGIREEFKERVQNQEHVLLLRSNQEPNQIGNRQFQEINDESTNMQIENHQRSIQLTNYPEILDKIELESEYRVHFIIKDISTFFPKMDVYKLLYDSLIPYGDVKEISCQKIDNNTTCFFVGMKSDAEAIDILENNRLNMFLDSFVRGEMRPVVGPSESFRLYLNFAKQVKGHVQKKEELPKKRKSRFSTNVNQMEIETPNLLEVVHNERQERIQEDVYQSKKKKRISKSRSRSRSRSKSPPHYSKKVDETLPPKERILELPEYLNLPNMSHQMLPQYLERHPNLQSSHLPQNTIAKPLPPQTGQSLQVPKPENSCCILGIPREISEDQVKASLITQNFEAPIKSEWCKDGFIEYLKLYFSSDKAVKELLIRDVEVMISPESLTFTVLVLPCMKDKRINDLLLYHQVQVESSLPVDGLFLNLFYNPYGPITDIIDIRPTKHVIIFSKQAIAQQVHDNALISLERNDTQLILKSAFVDECYPIIRKNVEAHMMTVLRSCLNSMLGPHVSTTEIEAFIRKNQQKERKLPVYFGQVFSCQEQNPPEETKMTQSYPEIMSSTANRYQEENPARKGMRPGHFKNKQGYQMEKHQNPQQHHNQSLNKRGQMPQPAPFPTQQYREQERQPQYQARNFGKNH